MVPTIRRTDPPPPSGSPLSRKGWAGVPWRTRARGMGSKEEREREEDRAKFDDPREEERRKDRGVAG